MEDWFIDPQLLAFGNLTMFAAAFTRRITGFGFAMISVGLLSMFLHPVEAVATTLLLVTVLSVRNVPIMRAAADWPLAIRLAGLGVIGVPVGVALARSVPEDLLKGVIGAVILTSLVPMVLRPPRVRPTARLPVAVSGVSAGFLNAVAAIPAPPLLVYLMARQDVALDVRRATLIAIFTLLSLIALGGHVIGGTVDRASLQHALCMVPGTLLGDILGQRFRWSQYRLLVDRLSMGIVALSSAMLFAGAVGG